MIAGLFYFSKEWRGAVKKAESTHKYFFGVGVRKGESMCTCLLACRVWCAAVSMLGLQPFFTSVGIPCLGSSTTIASPFTC